MTDRNPKICLVDVCGTLYDTTTTSGFVRFLQAEPACTASLRFRLLEHLRRPPFRSAVIAAGKALDRDFFRDGYISVLRGRDQAELRHLAREYVTFLDTQKRIEETHRRVAQAEADGFEIILVSNSLDIVVEAIAHRRGVRWCASRLSWRSGVCRGHLAQDIKGRKLTAVRDLLQEDFDRAEFMVVTDNKTDRDLIEASGTTVLITKHTERAWMRGLYDELICH